MNPYDYFARPELFDPRGTPYANDAAAQPNALFQPIPGFVDPARYSVMNLLTGRNVGADEAWASSQGSPWQRSAVADWTRNFLASEPAGIAMTAANFLGPAMGRIPRPVFSAEGGGGGRLPPRPLPPGRPPWEPDPNAPPPPTNAGQTLMDSLAAQFEALKNARPPPMTPEREAFLAQQRAEIQRLQEAFNAGDIKKR